MFEVRVAGLWVREGRLLLGLHEKRDERYWVVPGGHVEPGESLPAALVREFLEEVGVPVAVGDLVFVNDSGRPGRAEVALYFAVQPQDPGAEPRRISTGSIRGSQFFRAEELERLDVRPPIREVLLAYLRTGRVDRVYLGPR